VTKSANQHTKYAAHTMLTDNAKILYISAVEVCITDVVCFRYVPLRRKGNKRGKDVTLTDCHFLRYILAFVNYNSCISL